MESLEYIKQRIASGTTGLSDCKFESMKEVNTLEIFEFMYHTKALENGVTLKTENGQTIAVVDYCKDYDFNYFTMYRCINDGTLIFDLATMGNVLRKVLNCNTYNKQILKEVPDDEFFNTHYFWYVVGNIVLCQEHDDKFGTKEKPWLTQRTTALLPIKFEVMKSNYKDKR